MRQGDSHSRVSRGDLKTSFFSIFEWWWKHHKAMLRQIAFQSGRPDDALLIDVDEVGSFNPVLGAALSTPNWRFVVRRRGKESVLSPRNLPVEVSLHSRPLLPIGLRLPSSMVLRYELALPAAVEAYLESAVSFEIDRITPFCVDEVFWSIQNLRRDQGSLRLALLIVPQKPLSALFSKMADMRISISFIESGDLNIPINQDQAAPHLRQKKLMLFCFLTLLPFALPVLFQQYLLIRANDEIEILQPFAQKASDLRRDEDNHAKIRDIIVRFRKANDTLGVLEKLTSALPDGTSLSQLATSNNIIIISGQSTNAAGLIPILEKVPGFYGPRISGSITEIASSNSDIFTIDFSTKPGSFIGP